MRAKAATQLCLRTRCVLMIVVCEQSMFLLRGKRMTVNKAVIGLLEEHLTQNKMKRAELYHDLDALCGSWTEDAAAAFNRALAKQRAIDQDVWKSGRLVGRFPPTISGLLPVPCSTA